MHLWFTFTGGGETESSDTELPLGLLFCPLLLSCGGGGGASCKSNPLDTAEGSPSLSLACPPPLGDKCFLTLGFRLDTCVCLLGHYSQDIGFKTEFDIVASYFEETLECMWASECC